jgi:hypothetical protein
MNINFSTYFDINYFNKFLCLKNSLDKYLNNYKIYCLDLDNVIRYSNIKNNINIEVIKLSEIENIFPELYYAKKNRSKIEYYFTLTPFLQRYIFIKYNLSQLSYIDSDLFFFNTPKNLYKNYQNKNYNILLSPHNNKYVEKKFGKFNVGLIIMKNTKTTSDCLKYWSEECINFCIDSSLKNKFADQKYLDEWPQKYKGIKIIDKYLVNIGPWNAKFLNSKNFNKLIAFHFHGIYFNINYNFYISGVSNFNIEVDKVIVRKVYKIYLDSLLNVNTKLNTNTKQSMKMVNLRYRSLKLKLIKFLKIINCILRGDLYLIK